ncbi:MAG: hypothetical protein PHX83_16260 [Acidobacteriia bacterium]|nr:hypothetical protein [Terriglobia bacterium]
MKRPVVPILMALIITLLAAYYQRVTGPTYPYRGNITVGERTYSYRLPRSFDRAGDCEVRLKDLDAVIQATVSFRRLGVSGPWDTLVMKRQGNDVVAWLPHQPPAGILEYYITLDSPPRSVSIAMEDPIRIRFHGEVPRTILLPHIVFMFAGMWASTFTGILAVLRRPGFKKAGWWAVAFLVAGGFLLGPLVQHFAFGRYWLGVPFGCDLTDNKTLIVIVFWLVALWANRAKDRPRWIIAAAYVLLIVYCIPHSVKGTQLDYSTMKVKTG